MGSLSDALNAPNREYPLDINPNSFRGCLADPNMLSSTITSASEGGGWIKAPEPPADAQIFLCSVFFYFWGPC